jgi:hypothetical protein
MTPGEPRRPLVLPCGHTLCSGCLSRLNCLDRKELNLKRCPLCNDAFDADSRVTNIVVQRLLEVLGIAVTVILDLGSSNGRPLVDVLDLPQKVTVMLKSRDATVQDLKQAYLEELNLGHLTNPSPFNLQQQRTIRIGAYLKFKGQLLVRLDQRIRDLVGLQDQNQMLAIIQREIFPPISNSTMVYYS